MGLEKQATHTQMVEYVRCLGDVEYFITNYVRVWRKDTQDYGPYTLSSQLKLILDDLQKEACNNTIIKARQMGGSTLVHAFLAHQLMFRPSMRIAVGANTLAFTRDHIIHEIRRIIMESPDFMQPGFYKDDNSKGRFTLENNSQLHGMAISKDGIRGFGADIVYVDELCWCQYAEEFRWAAIGSLHAKGKIIAVTTPGKENRHIAQYSNGNTLVRAHKWFLDERFNQHIRWEKTFLGFHKNIIGTDVLHEQDPQDYLKLVKDGYTPHSDYTDKLRPAYGNDELFNQQMASQFYLHVNPEEEGL